MLKINLKDFYKVLFTLFSLLFTGSSAAEFLVDDGYTVQERYDRYVKTEPGLAYPDPQLAEGMRIYQDRAYAYPNQTTQLNRMLHLDIYQPKLTANQTAPGVMLIHGGGWRSGNKSHMFALANELVKRGYIVFTPEYRLSTEAQFPAGLVDLNNAILWIKANAKQYQLDINKLAIGGGSSGGHMAALLGFSGSTGHFIDASNPLQKTFNTKVNAIIDMDGVVGLTTPEALEYENKKGKNSAMGLWLGASYQDDKKLWEQASPLLYINEHSPALLFISSGQMRFAAGYQQAKAKLEVLNIATEFYLVQQPQTIHTFWLFEPWLSKTADKIDLFLKKAFN
ncbi:alpha/beta hydrolase [Catenovulum sp. 2E275]|uniref:alpha/beta hydrolase n=1 Tax=Catenovulum sp. 2E275 TaxID=2980497 RepID=UPI0021D19440|nr:alpha/beta hydrolase [Catenovulum sp. 2E275]MCU4675268.1 alpha/beta hydrolase [Catenovulum sp. 2E275]